MLRRVVSAAAAVLAAGGLVGCGSVFPTACPAIGWINVVIVTAEDDRIAAIDLCDARGCASGMDGLDDVAGFQQPRGDGATWTFPLSDMSAPRDATVRALAADGTVLSERDVRLEWERVGGSEACGGPAEARIEL